MCLLGVMAFDLLFDLHPSAKVALFIVILLIWPTVPRQLDHYSKCTLPRNDMP